MRFTPLRGLGRTGFRATALGIGDLADRAVPIERCVATVRRALDAGLNVIDTAPGYENGYSEEIVGRDRMFVIDKIDHSDEPVAPQIATSLERLDMTHVDLFVFHGVSETAAWDRLAAPSAAGAGGRSAQAAVAQKAPCCRGSRSRTACATP